MLTNRCIFRRAKKTAPCVAGDREEQLHGASLLLVAMFVYQENSSDVRQLAPPTPNTAVGNGCRVAALAHQVIAGS